MFSISLALYTLWFSALYVYAKHTHAQKKQKKKQKTKQKKQQQTNKQKADQQSAIHWIGHLNEYWLTYLSVSLSIPSVSFLGAVGKRTFVPSALSS